MGTNLPSNRKQALEWLEARLANWADDPASIGLTSALVTHLTTKTVNARSAFVSVESVRTDAKNATQGFYTAADAMHDAASPMIASIKSFAESSSDPGTVYTAAEVLPPDPPSPIAPPSQPSIDGASLDGNGWVTINFSATGPIGTVWQVSRQLAGETSYSIIGNADVKTKSFVDATVPAGTTNAMYQVQGIRGSIVGPVSFGFDVKFGQSADGEALGMAA